MKFILFKKKIRRLAAIMGILRPLKSVITRIRGGEEHYKKNLHWYSRFIKPGQIVFDVGANRGQSSELFIKLGARVVAFEPQSDLHAEIRQLCGNSPQLEIESCGLSDREEIRLLHITDYDQVASLREDWEGIRIGTSEIHLSTLDIQIAKHGLPSYCKIDVEGWEPQVLAGLHQPIPVISFEYHISQEENLRALEVLNMISRLGNYFCNIKEENGDVFALPNSLHVTRFCEGFPYNLGVTLKDGYGDIYCSLDPLTCASSVQDVS